MNNEQKELAPHLHPLQILYDFNYEDKPRFNNQLLNHSPFGIIEALKAIILSCQRSQFFTIRVESFEVIDDPIMVNEFLKDFESSKKNKDNPYDYIDMKDTDMDLLLVNYYLAIKDQDMRLQVPICVPRIVDKYYFRISGNFYSAMYQAVDASTYNNSNASSKNTSITLKTINGPIRIKRDPKLYKTESGETKTLILYDSNIFSKNAPVISYMLAKVGLIETMQFLGINCITIGDKIKNDNTYSFEHKGGFFVNVPKFILDNDHVTQSFVCTILKTPCKAYNDLFTIDFWVRSLGFWFNNASTEKGLAILESLEGLNDQLTNNAILLPKEEKLTIYHILRWMIREFSNLVTKDNLDISLKRIRYEEYIASYYALKLSKGIHRISEIGKKADIKTIKNALNTRPNFLISEMTRCKLINYRNSVNDMDAFQKITFKGPSGLGENKGSSIPEYYRHARIEQLGRIDQESSQATDPGLTSVLCPYVDLYSNVFFSDFQEPLTWETEFAQLMRSYKAVTGMKEVVSFRKLITGESDQDEEQIINESLIALENLIHAVEFVNASTEYVDVNVIGTITSE